MYWVLHHSHQSPASGRGNTRIMSKCDWSRHMLALFIIWMFAEVSSSSKSKGNKICPVLKEHHHDESIYNIPIFRDALRKNINYNPDDYKRKTSYIFGNKSCPKRKTNSCPHHYVMNFDPNRKPAMIFTAQCTCSFCKNGECRPFLHYRFVQERDSGDDCFQWRLRGYPTKCDCQEGESKNPRKVPPDGDGMGSTYKY